MPRPSSGNCPAATRCAAFEGHTGFVKGLTLTADGKWLITASADQTIRVWDLATGKSVFVIQGLAEPVYSVVVSDNGKELITGVGGQDFQTTKRCTWDLVTGKQKGIVEVQAKGMRSMARSNSRLITSDGDPLVRIWGAAGRELVPAGHLPRRHLGGL